MKCIRIFEILPHFAGFLISLFLRLHVSGERLFLQNEKINLEHWKQQSPNLQEFPTLYVFVYWKSYHLRNLNLNQNIPQIVSNWRFPTLKVFSPNSILQSEKSEFLNWKPKVLRSKVTRENAPLCRFNLVWYPTKWEI